MTIPIKLDTVHPIWVGIALLVLLIGTNWLRKRWPTEREIVELIALGGGLVAAILMFTKCVNTEDGYDPWVLLAGAAVVGLVSTRGIWRIFTNKSEDKQIVEPRRD